MPRGADGKFVTAAGEINGTYVDEQEEVSLSSKQIDALVLVAAAFIVVLTKAGVLH